MVTREKTRHLLPRNVRYEYVNLMLVRPGLVCCQNCGQPLVTVVTVKNPAGAEFRVGTECAYALSGIVESNRWKLENNEFTEVYQFMKLAVQADVEVSELAGITVYARSTRAVKGRHALKSVFVRQLEQYAPGWREEVGLKLKTMN